MKVKSENEVAQLCLTLRDPMNRSLPGSSVHGIFQARVPEWVASAFSWTGAAKKKNKSTMKKIHMKWRENDWVALLAVWKTEHHQMSLRNVEEVTN